MTGDPGAVLALVVIGAPQDLLLVDELHSVLANEDVGGSSLKLVGRDGFVDRLDGRSENVVESLLVCGRGRRKSAELGGGEKQEQFEPTDRHADSDVREVLLSRKTDGSLSREEERVAGHLTDGKKDLGAVKEEDEMSEAAVR